MENKELTQEILKCAFKVHSELGPGLLESAYQRCLAVELRKSGLSFQKEKSLDIIYYDEVIENMYRMDFVVENKVILELKSVDQIAPIHKAQLITYLKLAKVKTGLLFNFNNIVLKDGIYRLYNPDLKQ